MPTFTDEDLVGVGNDAPVDNNFGPRRVFTDEELAPGYTPPEKRGILSNSPDDGWISSALKSAGTIGTDIAAGTLGMVGEAANMGSILGAKVASTIDPSKSTSERHNEFVKGRKENMPWLIDMSDVKDFITPFIGEYKPTTAPGRMLQTGLGAAGMALTPGGEERNVGLATRALEEGLPAFLGGAGAQAVGEYTQDPFLSIVAGLGGGLAGRTGVTAHRNWANPEESASRIAGQALRENATDPTAAKANLSAYDSADFLPGMPARSSVIGGDPGLIAMDVLMGNDARFKGKDTNAEILAHTVAGDAKTANTVVSKGAEDAAANIKPDVQSTYGISGNTPKQDSSEAVRSIYGKLEENAHKGMEDAWQDPRIANAQMYKNKVLSQIDDYINGLDITNRKAIPADVLDTIEQIRGMDGKTIPLTELQSLRSRVLSVSRKEFSGGDRFVGGANYALGRKLGDIISDGGNIQFGDKPRVLPGAPAGSPIGTARDAWQKAVDATRNYHQTFNEGFLKDLNAEDGGKLKLAANQTLDEAFKPSYGTKALEQLQSVTNGAINAPASDYLIAKLTNDGSKIVKPADVDRWLAQGSNAALVDKIPGLRARINQIRNATATDQLSMAFERAANNPEKVVKLFNDHRQAINTLVPAAQRPYFNMLEKSAKMASTEIPDTPAGLTGALKKLATGNTSDLLYAVGSGRLASIFAGVTSAIAAGHLLPESVAAYLPETLWGDTILGGALGSVHLGPIDMKRPIETILTGKVRQRAIDILQAARNDPKLMAELMDKPSPEKLSHLLGVGGLTGVTTAAESGVDQGRNGFASGGAVSDEDGEAARLIRETDAARKFLSSQTEAILDKPDDHVVAALNAVKNII